ncbi:MAG TPA: hypothetical protein VEJ41_10270 [Candidatus Acidoferrales bacterium]|nr:hypothetical protein [Candidatus Acidoferrales bacterium]
MATSPPTPFLRSRAKPAARANLGTEMRTSGDKSSLIFDRMMAPSA